MRMPNFGGAMLSPYSRRRRWTGCTAPAVDPWWLPSRPAAFVRTLATSTRRRSSWRFAWRLLCQAGLYASTRGAVAPARPAAVAPPIARLARQGTLREGREHAARARAY